MTDRQDSFSLVLNFRACTSCIMFHWWFLQARHETRAMERAVPYHASESHVSTPLANVWHIDGMWTGSWNSIANLSSFWTESSVVVRWQVQPIVDHGTIMLCRLVSFCKYPPNPPWSVLVNYSGTLSVPRLLYVIAFHLPTILYLLICYLSLLD
jgi:hypothetical protein